MILEHCAIYVLYVHQFVVGSTILDKVFVRSNFFLSDEVFDRLRYPGCLPRQNCLVSFGIKFEKMFAKTSSSVLTCKFGHWSS